MPSLIYLPTYTDARGSLTVVEKIIPFEIKRFYYIYNAKSLRGGHRHKKTIQALICIAGNCKIYVNTGYKEEYFFLDSPEKCLILAPKDWHTMDEFSRDAVLLVLASEYYDINDYIDDKY